MDLSKRNIYAIFPSSEEGVFGLENLNNYIVEYIECKELGKYFDYRIVDVKE